MDPSLLTVAAGMRAQMETLEVVGNNIANAGTHGYKADRDFYRLFLSAQAQADPLTGQISRMPFVQGSTIDFNQGAFIPTEAPLDVALSGPGFLVVEGPGGELYTRSGSLRRSASGVLETAEGFSVLDSQRGSITIPPNGKIEVGGGGMISIEGLEVAELLPVEFEKGAGSVEGRQQLFPRRRRNHPATGRRDEPESREARSVQCECRRRSRALDACHAPFSNDAARGFTRWRRAERPRDRGTRIDPIGKHSWAKRRTEKSLLLLRRHRPCGRAGTESGRGQAIPDTYTSTRT